MSVRRSSGALAPLFSLPGVRDVGSLGRSARRFVDFLADSGQRWWQSLPVNPIDRFGSPYAGRSAFAGETLYLDLEDLRDEGLLDDADLVDAWFLPGDASSPNCANSLNSAFPPSSTPQTDARSERIDYRAAFERRRPRWRKAFERYRDGIGGAKYRALEKHFRYENSFWLDDYVLFAALSEERGYSWRDWPVEFRRRDAAALAEFAEKRADELDYLRFLQLVFDVQWNELRSYCAARDVGLFGDVPIYVGKNSADVWAFRDLFQVDLDGRTIREAGVPADDFNPDGQRWNSPLYRWERHRETDFDWWRRRMKKTLSRFDLVRLDHFIGFYNFYSFPGDGAPENAETSSERDVKNQTITEPRRQKTNFVKKLIISLFGKSKVNQSSCDNQLSKPHIVDGVAYEDGWEPGPQETFFNAIFADCPREAFVAEDLGVMNAGVCALRDRYRLPGMQVFQFSFDDVKIDAETNAAPNPLENWSENYVAYTGTHDAAPILGWLSDVEKYGGDAWPSLDFAGIVDVLERYRRADDVPAAILDGDASSETPSNSTQSAQSAKTSDSTAPTLGVSLRCEPLSAQIAALRTAALRAVAQSPCRLAIFPIQDVLGLSNDARVNFPGVESGNWTWRFADDALTPETCRELRKLTEESGRAA